MPALPIRGEEATWRVGTVYCLGKNYRAHAVEMGQIEPRPPVVFLKPAASVVPFERTLPIPTDRGAVHHEVELVLALSLPAGHVPGAPLTAAEAGRTIAAYTVGLDLTLRDEQQAAKEAGEPWASAKGFPGSAPVAPLTRADLERTFVQGELCLRVGGVERQRAPLSDMTMPPAAIVAALSRVFPLCTGDVVFTGTPAGVGPLTVGDAIDVRLTLPEGGIRCTTTVVAKT